MKGWSLLAAFINFAILAGALYFLGRRLVGKMIGAYRDKVAQSLKEADQTLSDARALLDDAPQRRRKNQERLDAVRAKAGRDLALLREDNDRETAREVSGYEERVTYHKEKLKETLNRKLAAAAADKIIAAAEEKLTAPSAEAALQAMNHEFALMLDGVIKPCTGRKVSVRVRCARPLADEDLALIKTAASAAAGEAAVSYDIGEDPALIGGIRLEMDDWVYDTTVRNNLERIRREILTDGMTGGDFQEALTETINGSRRRMAVYEAGYVDTLRDGIAHVRGLKRLMYGEMMTFPNGSIGMGMDLLDGTSGVMLLDNPDAIEEGDEVRRTGRIIEVPVGEALIGRVVDTLGRPIDDKGIIRTTEHRPIESPAPGVLERQPVTVPLQTGLKAVDALVPIGRGQRELIIGDRQTGKTAIALDAIINQKDTGVICVYVAIGQKESTVAGFVSRLEAAGAMDYTVVVAANASEAAPMLYLAPYTGAAIGEYFMYSGRDVLIVYDDLSKQAVAYREISLLLQRPPGREAYPGDIFYVHSRLLERAARLSDEKGGGSMTALPIIETQDGDISAYIPTNVISITDGQIFLESELFNSGVRPAVNVGLSVSRVGGAAQLGAVKQVAGRLRMELAQYRELAAFSQFGSDLDKTTRETLNRGEKMTEILKQPQFHPMSAADQVIILYAAGQGYVDAVALKDAADYEKGLLPYVHTAMPDLTAAVMSGKKLSETVLAALRSHIEAYTRDFLSAHRM